MGGHLVRFRPVGCRFHFVIRIRYSQHHPQRASLASSCRVLVYNRFEVLVLLKSVIGCVLSLLMPSSFVVVIDSNMMALGRLFKSWLLMSIRMQ